MKHIFLCNNFPLDNFPCDICQLAKCHRLAFHDSVTFVSQAFDILHMDIWGPYKTTSIIGDSYIPTIIDEFSKRTWT